MQVIGAYMSQEQNTTQKKTVSRTEFDKRVDIERGYCEWTEYMNPQDARAEAYRRVSQEYQVAKTS